MTVLSSNNSVRCARDYDVLGATSGVVHNGVAAFPQACEALARLRRDGGTVILITNAPRAGASVQRILDRLARAARCS